MKLVPRSWVLFHQANKKRFRLHLNQGGLTQHHSQLNRIAALYIQSPSINSYCNSIAISNFIGLCK